MIHECNFHLINGNYYNMYKIPITKSLFLMRQVYLLNITG